MKFSGILNVQLCPNLLLSYTVNFRRLQNVEQAFNHHRLIKILLMDQYTLFKDILMFYNTFFPLSYVLVKLKKKDNTNALKDGKQNIKPHNLDDVFKKGVLIH
jgi:hypothetical protein